MTSVTTLLNTLTTLLNTFVMRCSGENMNDISYFGYLNTLNTYFYRVVEPPFSTHPVTRHLPLPPPPTLTKVREMVVKVFRCTKPLISLTFPPEHLIAKVFSKVFRCPPHQRWHTRTPHPTPYGAHLTSSLEPSP